MPTLNLEKYTNHLPLFKLSAEDIEKQIADFKLTFLQERNKQVEWGIRFPMFLRSFYKFVYHKGRIPQQEAFHQYYLVNNKDWFSEKQLDEPLMLGLKARVFRTYPSLVRDLHFAKTLERDLHGYEVVYNTHLDVEEGIDLLLKKKGRNIAVNLFTKTKRSLAGRIKKESRHQVYDNIEYVELPVAFKGSTEIGDFFLYGKREVKQLNEMIGQLGRATDEP